MTRSHWKEILCPVPGCRAFTWGVVRVFVGREPVGPNGSLEWHLSISCQNRYPTWDEIREARYEFIPDEITVAMILPPKSEYVNVHNNCFHLYQIQGKSDSAKVRAARIGILIP